MTRDRRGKRWRLSVQFATAWQPHKLPGSQSDGPPPFSLPRVSAWLQASVRPRAVFWLCRFVYPWQIVWLWESHRAKRQACGVDVGSMNGDLCSE